MWSQLCKPNMLKTAEGWTEAEWLYLYGGRSDCDAVVRLWTSRIVAAPQ